MRTAVNPAMYTRRLEKEKNFFCESCRCRVPESLLMEQDGKRICSVNCYYPNGGTIDRTQRRAAADDYAAQRMSEVEPALYPGAMDTASMINSWTPNPIRLVHGGATVTGTFTGVGFAASDVITVSNAGVTVGTPVLTLDTSMTIGFTASGGAALGNVDLTYNGNVFRSVLVVI